MSDIALTALEEGLHAFRNGLSFTPEWTAGQPMTEALALVRARHPGEARTVERERIGEIVNDYLLTGVVFRQDDVFDLCLGAGWLDGDGKGILADRELRGRLFALAETVTGRSRRLRAFRNLLRAYWTFPLHADATPPAAVAGWQELRGWLKERHAVFSRHPARKPSWFNALAPHLHLLADNPCAPYGEALLRGNLDELQRAIDCLLIPTDSWLKTEAVMAQLDTALGWPDQAFREVLANLLEMAKGNAGIAVPEGVARRAIARLVVRYAAQANYEPDEDLFLLAVEKIGNPWRQRAAWDSLACDADGNPSSQSREMVAGWLKDRLIGAFFGDAGQPDSRSEAWQKYSVFMQEISSAAPWLDAQGQALLMRLGDFLVVVPKYRGDPVAVYPWQAFFSGGGTRLLDKDHVDGGAVHHILNQRPPTLRTGQSAADTLKICEFAISTKAHLHPLGQR